MKNCPPMERQINSKERVLPANRSQLIENFNNEISDNSGKNLELINKKLNFLCLELDPYNVQDLKEEEENILDELHLKQYLANPFEFTNIILQMLNSVETEIKKRLH